MPSYVVTGASRGLGFEFIRQLSADPAAIVIGLARDKAATEKKVAAEIGRSNIHIFHGDLVDYESLKKAAEDTSKITGGRLDYLIANGALVGSMSAYRSLSDLGDDHKALEDDLLAAYKANVIGNINLINVFLPLIRKGDVKKVVLITSGHADLELVRDIKLYMAGPYAMSKAAMNLAIAKYHSELGSEGILFMSISPGAVQTSGYTDPTGLSGKDKAGLDAMVSGFAKYAPHWKGAIMPDESVKLIFEVINKSSVEGGDGGSFVSHYGNKQWL
ncbi:NAD(P)-binding protein [Annulohypoxylon maeteangense]|uniref:NAD(P)-binding protein n=1 Tax=Annulohypoxylon maeteangense TaxID=1927788 RepID=UPI0020083151|nr:NAD(P)-binding protein [Annulohypoxylon maeteangense]KAI0880488.1 NAD(P)-binding protein [Annulohypoxylon maeteangense]